MNTILFAILFALSSSAAVFLFLLGLRKLGSAIKNYAVLFTGINHLLLSIIIMPLLAKLICLIVGIFITTFSLVKIIRKMD